MVDGIGLAHCGGRRCGTVRDHLSSPPARRAHAESQLPIYPPPETGGEVVELISRPDCQALDLRAQREGGGSDPATPEIHNALNG